MRAVVTKKKEQFKKFFGNVQFGFGQLNGFIQLNGGEIVVHSVRNLLRANPSFTLISIDCRNAFNTVKRERFASVIQ